MELLPCLPEAKNNDDPAILPLMAVLQDRTSGYGEGNGKGRLPQANSPKTKRARYALVESTGTVRTER